jgi:hypothetical protein
MEGQCKGESGRLEILKQATARFRSEYLLKVLASK